MNTGARQWGMVGVLVLSMVSHVRAATHALVVVGVSGDQAMAARYQKELEGWQGILATAGVGKDQVTVIAGEMKADGKVEAEEAGRNVRQRVVAVLDRYGTQLGAQDDLLLVLIGYGATRNEEYVFQNRGPRLTGADFADGLKTCRARSITVFHTGPGGTGLAMQLADPRTVTVTATAGAGEINESQWGVLFVGRTTERTATTQATQPAARALVALLQATDEAVAEFYKQAHLARTEHAQLFVGTHPPIEAPFELDAPGAPLARWSFEHLDAAVTPSATAPSTTRAGSAPRAPGKEPGP